MGILVEFSLEGKDTVLDYLFQKRDNFVLVYEANIFQKMFSPFLIYMLCNFLFVTWKDTDTKNAV